MGNASEQRAKWTDAHVRQACARIHELVGRMVLENRIGGPPMGGVLYWVSEDDFRRWLRAVARFDVPRVDREVRRVDRLARGEWIRTVEHLVVHEDGVERHVRCTTIGRPRLGRPQSSRGCSRCCSYGSKEQQKAKAEAIIARSESPTDQPPRLCVAVIVLNGDGHVLAGQRNKDPLRGYWVLPGGGIEAGETWREAAIREVREETGLEVQIDARQEPIVVEHEAADTSGRRAVVLFVQGRAEGTPVGADDLMNTQWFGRFTIPEPKTPATIEALGRWLERRPL